MNVPTISVPVDEAKAKFREYRDAVNRRRTAEDVFLRECYRALWRGKKLLNLVDAMTSVGVNGCDAQGRPLLAIAKGGVLRCGFTWHCGKACFFDANDRWTRSRSKVIQFESNTVGRHLQDKYRRPDLVAVVPSVPPALRPDVLADYYILWEAEWETIPRDPFLLKLIRWPLFAIVAQWDLTEVERQVLGAMQ